MPDPKDTAVQSPNNGVDPEAANAAREVDVDRPADTLVEGVQPAVSADTEADDSIDPNGMDAQPDSSVEVSGNDDPLNFGDQRMPSDHPDTTAETAEGEQRPSIEELVTLLAASEAKAEDNWARVLRMQADMENQRKRAQKDVEKARKFALESLVNDLLPVKDSLEMGISAARSDDADIDKILEGSDLTLKMLVQAFEKYNICEVDPTDQKFDPEFHQAMSMQEVEGKEANTVVGVMQKGYTLNERLIRPALVMVAK